MQDQNLKLIKICTESLNGNSDGLLAYYTMDTNDNFKIIDYSSNQYHASIDHVDILPEFLSSENCPDGPDGSYGCPYPTILDALEKMLRRPKYIS